MSIILIFSNEESVIDVLKKYKRSRSKQLALIFEKSTSFIGREVSSFSVDCF